MNQKKLIVVVVVVVSLFIAGLVSTRGNNDANKAHDVISQKLQTVSNGSGSFSITSMTEPAPGWYIAKIKPAYASTDNPIAVLKKDGNSFNLIAGPGTSIALSVVQQNHIPSAVTKQLLVYDDVATNTLPYSDPAGAYTIDNAAGSTTSKPAYLLIVSTSSNCTVADNWLQSQKFYKKGAYRSCVIDPTRGKLPHQSIDFSIVLGGYNKTSSGTFQPAFVANLYVPNAQANDPAATASYKSEVVNYLQSLGASPSSYTITYVTGSN